MSHNLFKSAALKYAASGWRVHPLKPDGKEPLLRHGVHDASTDCALIEQWWGRWPNANIGVATGPGAIDVLDVDTKHNGRGLELAEQARNAGLLSGWTGVVETPSGGLHIWFPPSGNGGGAIGKRRDLEVKGAGGYVLMPPSYVIARDEHGAVIYEGVYRLTKVRDGGAPLDWQAVKDLLVPRPVMELRPWTPADGRLTFDGLIRRVAEQTSASGNRNNCLFWAACRAVEGGAPPAVFRDLVDAAVGNGLPERSAWSTVVSAQRSASRRAA
jgi:hypothetical protein